MLTQVLASHSLRIERHEQIIASLPQLLHRDRRRTLDHSALVVLQYRPEDGRRNPVGHLVLASVVWMGELERRAEHPAQHRVRMGDENRWIDHETGVVDHKGDPVFALSGGHVRSGGRSGNGGYGGGRRLLGRRLQQGTRSGNMNAFSGCLSGEGDC